MKDPPENDVSGIYTTHLNVTQPPGRVDVDYDRQWPFITDMLPGDKNARILDLGCGNGRYAQEIARLGYGSVVGVDTFPDIAAKDVEYRQGTLEQIPAETDEFDLIICASAIYYAETRNSVGEIARVIAPGGRVFASGHTLYSPQTTYRRWLRKRGSKKARHLAGVTFRDFSTYARAFEDAGGTVDLVDGFYLVPLTPFLIMPAFKRLRDRTGIAYARSKGPSRSHSLGRFRARYGYHFVLEVSFPRARLESS